MCLVGSQPGSPKSSTPQRTQQTHRVGALAPCGTRCGILVGTDEARFRPEDHDHSLGKRVVFCLYPKAGAASRVCRGTGARARFRFCPELCRPSPLRTALPSL